jgi:hypothetical protein
MEMLDSIMKWIVAPVTAFVWLIYQRQADQHTDIALLKSQTSSDRMYHDREMKEMRETVKAIFSKLDTIEASLRGK